MTAAPSPAPASEAKPKTRPASFRLALPAWDKLYAQSAAAGLSTRAWLEQAILDNATHIVAKQKLHPDLRELLFQVNKTGNNLNQLAHHFNSLSLKGAIPSTEVTLALSALERISQTLQDTLDRAR